MKWLFKVVILCCATFFIPVLINGCLLPSVSEFMYPLLMYWGGMAYAANLKRVCK